MKWKLFWKHSKDTNVLLKHESILRGKRWGEHALTCRWNLKYPGPFAGEPICARECRWDTLRLLLLSASLPMSNPFSISIFLKYVSLPISKQQFNIFFMLCSLQWFLLVVGKKGTHRGGVTWFILCLNFLYFCWKYIMWVGSVLHILTQHHV